MKNLTRVTALAAVLSTLATGAMADTIDLKLTSLGNGGTALISSNSGSTWSNQWAGEFQMVATNSTNLSSLQNGPYDIFCLELLSGISFNTPYRYDVVGLSTVNPDGSPPALGASGAEAIQDMWNFANGRQYDSNNFAQAFQLALWEITFDGSLANKDSGVFRFDGGTAVNQIVAQLFDAININSTPIYLAGLTNRNAQDLLVNPNQNKVPEPGSLAVLGLGLVGLGAVRRRKM